MGAEREACKAGFLPRSQGKAHHNKIGCLDGSHIEILKPKESSSSYFNRKKFPSVVLQGICDARSRYIDVFVSFPGSAHDAHVLRQSPFIKDAEVNCGGDYILSDAAYPLLPWLLAPYKHCGASFSHFKQYFNRRHSQQRVVFEHGFVILKQRFRRLYFIEADTINPSCVVILGACVLQNMCCESIDDLNDISDYYIDGEIGNEDGFAITSSYPRGMRDTNKNNWRDAVLNRHHGCVSSLQNIYLPHFGADVR